MTDNGRKKLIILTGPTAAGKTALSIELAKRIGGQIISADSMQVYKGMDIGTAKITNEEMDGVRHHLIDIYDPDFAFNVSEFVKCAKKAISDITAEGDIPVVAGGTAFYIQALLKDVDFSSDSASDEEFRMMAERAAVSLEEHAFNKFKKKYFKDIEAKDLYGILKSVDADACLTIHGNNTKKIIRALEYFVMTGEKISVHNRRESAKSSDYDFVYFVLSDDREKLYERINARVDKMLEAGLVDEVKGLMARGYGADLVSMQGIGYKEIIEYLESGISYEHAVESIKQNTRHFAKRQLTWFRREKDVIWMDYSEFNYDRSKMLNKMLSILKEKNIL
ncbi:MAG: tRNA (adenosine(37)-N6)-dimethylallyltransferase MiaA [Clostridiales bacterium]|nr:tRNA (adenosine(37)-N6)-dimethylallyltransferase MiaA [Clostridiales bacterium]MBS5877892.1 tRNA (adenosine(37)-N6)-dimethylallyltransferase MiaA [Clostridiales bacterium]MDU3490686.1 tRNA (adenosine(37)-N6)-dimethylallyltransferase MiaA [Clostridiales bacterium]